MNEAVLCQAIYKILKVFSCIAICVVAVLVLNYASINGHAGHGEMLGRGTHEANNDLIQPV